MKKLSACFMCFALLIIFSICSSAVIYSDEEGAGSPETRPQQEPGTENVPPHKTWDKAWSGYFGRDLPDPLADPNMTPEEWNRQREQAGKRGQAAAEFTEAATSLVSAGAPTPGGAAGAVAGATQQAITESAQAIVEAETTPPPAKPGVLRRIWNWIKSWF